MIYKTCKKCNGEGSFTDPILGPVYCRTCRGTGVQRNAMSIGWIAVIVTCVAWIVLGILIVGLELGILHP